MTLSPLAHRGECDHGRVSTAPTQAPSAPPESGEDKRRKRLLSYSNTNMIYSMLAVVALAFAWWALMPNPPDAQRRPAEVEQAADFASRQADWPVWSPVGLGGEWSPTIARFGATEGVPDWRQNWVSPLQQSVVLQQADGEPDAWISANLDGLTEQPALALGSPGGEQEWAVWTGVNDNDEREVALVLEPTADQPATTVVSGTADIPEMTTFVDALEVVEPTE